MVGCFILAYVIASIDDQHLSWCLHSIILIGIAFRKYGWIFLTKTNRGSAVCTSGVLLLFTCGGDKGEDIFMV